MSREPRASTGAVPDRPGATGLRSVPPALPAEVARLARPHDGIVSRSYAVWDAVAGDLIRKAPAAAHEVIITPQVDTLFLTQSTSPRRVIKRSGRQGDRTLTNEGGLLNFVAAGDTLVTVAPEGMPQMQRLAIAFLPRAMERLDSGTSPRWSIFPLRIFRGHSG